MGREEEKKCRKHHRDRDDHDDDHDSRGEKRGRDHNHRKKKESSSSRRNSDEDLRRHRKRSRRDDEDSSSSSRRHRRKDSHRRKSEDRHNRKKKKSKKKSRDYSDDEESRKKSKRKNKDKPKKQDKSSFFPMGDPMGRAPQTLVNAETDYFTYHQEFWVYLFREEGIRFNDLSSDESRAAFRRFAKEYNAGSLEAPYYEKPPTFPAEVLEESKTTQHKWGFQTSETERRGLEQLQAGVRRLTDYQDGDTGGDKSHDDPQKIAGSSSVPARNDDHHQQRRKTPEDRMEERRKNKRLREHVRTAEEEITGGVKDFRERQIEKKREHAARLHGAARDKEEGAGVELDDSALYGDGDRSFKDALAHEKQAKLRREEKRNARVEELQNKERERQENMLKMLGLQGMKPGQKIQIAPREDK